MKLRQSLRSRVVFDLDQREDFLRFQSEIKRAPSPLSGSGESTEKPNKQRNRPNGKIRRLGKVLVNGQSQERNHDGDACISRDADCDDPFGLAEKFFGELYQDRFAIGGHGARHFMPRLSVGQGALLCYGGA